MQISLQLWVNTKADEVLFSQVMENEKSEFQPTWSRFKIYPVLHAARGRWAGYIYTFINKIRVSFNHFQMSDWTQLLEPGQLLKNIFKQKIASLNSEFFLY